MKKEGKLSINEQIKSRRVFLIDESGKMLGEFMRNDAIEMAREREMDLVEVNKKDRSICKIMDYNKFLYDKKKKQKAQSKQQTQKTKEVKLSPRIAEHDLSIRLRQAREFLSSGHRVRVTMFYRKRSDLRHKGIGEAKFNEFCAALNDIGQQQQRVARSARSTSVYYLSIAS